jgi:DNA polymerase-3 subunit delta'
MTFDETFQMVKRAIDSGRPAHGYLIVGSVRNHGMKITQLIIQNLFCTAAEKPCGQCAACKRVEEHTEPDVHWIFPEMKSRVISAEQMREKLLAEIAQTSFSGGWKVGVLVGADRLNDSSANAFLKTLEEPPEQTLFLLLTDTPQQLMPTIISRCQRIDLDAFRELSEPWLGTLVSTLSSPYFRTPLERLVMSGQLSKLLEEMKEKAEVWVKEEFEKEKKVDEDEDVFLAKVSARYRELRMDFLVTLMRWFRDLFVVKAGGSEEIHFKEKAELLKERAGRLTLAQTLYNVNAIEELARQLDRNLSEETVLAYAVDRIAHGVGDKP